MSDVWYKLTMVRSDGGEEEIVVSGSSIMGMKLDQKGGTELWLGTNPWICTIAEEPIDYEAGGILSFRRPAIEELKVVKA